MKWIFRYLRGTSKVCLSFGGLEPSLEGYTDSGMGGDLENLFLGTYLHLQGYVMAAKATKVCFTIYYRSRVYYSYRSWKIDVIDEAVSSRTRFKTETTYYITMVKVQ